MCVHVCVCMCALGTAIAAHIFGTAIAASALCPLRRRGLERAQVLPNASIIRFCGQSTQFNATGHAAYVSVRVCQCMCVSVGGHGKGGGGKVHFTSKLACAFFSVGIATSASYSLLFCCSLVLLWFRRFTAAVLSISYVIFSMIYVCACLCVSLYHCVFLFPPNGPSHTHKDHARLLCKFALHVIEFLAANQMNYV